MVRTQGGRTVSRRAVYELAKLAGRPADEIREVIEGIRGGTAMDIGFVFHDRYDLNHWAVRAIVQQYDATSLNTQQYERN